MYTAQSNLLPQLKEHKHTIYKGCKTRNKEFTFYPRKITFTTKCRTPEKKKYIYIYIYNKATASAQMTS